MVINTVYYQLILSREMDYDIFNEFLGQQHRKFEKTLDGRIVIQWVRFSYLLLDLPPVSVLSKDQSHLDDYLACNE